MALYSFGNIEMWHYTAFGTEMWHYTALGTQRCETIQVWEHRAVVLYSCGTIEL